MGFPTSLGSGGGISTTFLHSSSDRTGAGGGAIHLVSEQLSIDGAVTSNGNSGYDGGSSCVDLVGHSNACVSGGGGSGGSVLIETIKMDGSGSITVKGGNTTDRSGKFGGSGAGGRVGIHIAQEDNFNGEIHTRGGNSGTKERNGAAGTLYWNRHSICHLHVDNDGIDSDVKTDLCGSQGTDMFVLEDMDIRGSARTHLSLARDMCNFTLGNIYGDETALLEIPSNATLHVSGSTFTESLHKMRAVADVFGNSSDTNAHPHFPFILIDVLRPWYPIPVHIMLLEDGRLLPPETVVLQSKRTDENVFVNGVIGFKEVRVQSGVTVEFAGRIRSEHQAELEMMNLLVEGTLIYNGDLDVSRPLQLSGSLEIRGGGMVHVTRLRLEALYLTIHCGGEIDASGKGFPAGVGPGAGLSTALGSELAAAGAGHGGGGASGYHLPCSNTTCAPYGNMFQPLLPGSGGGSV